MMISLKEENFKCLQWIGLGVVIERKNDQENNDHNDQKQQESLTSKEEKNKKDVIKRVPNTSAILAAVERAMMGQFR